MLLSVKAKRTETQRTEAVVQRLLSQARRDGQRDAYAGKRRQPRFSWQASVTVEVVGTRTSQAFYATTRDIGAGGMGLRTRQRLAPLTVVRVNVEGEDEPLNGRVRHCSETVGAFLIGIEFVRSEAA